MTKKRLTFVAHRSLYFPVAVEVAVTMTRTACGPQRGRTKMPHSKTPWTYKPAKVVRDRHHGITTHIGAEITDAADEHVIAAAPVVQCGDVGNWSEDSEFIVRAVNCHHDLLAALKTLMLNAGPPALRSPTTVTGYSLAWDAAKDVIARAQGEKLVEPWDMCFRNKAK